MPIYRIILFIRSVKWEIMTEHAQVWSSSTHNRVNRPDLRVLLDQIVIERHMIEAIEHDPVKQNPSVLRSCPSLNKLWKLPTLLPKNPKLEDVRSLWCCSACSEYRTSVQQIALSLLLYRLDKGFGHALGIAAAPETIRHSKSRM